MNGSSNFRRKRSDTKIATFEKTYGVDLNVRSDTRLGNLLKRRGFDSQSQLLQALRQNLDTVTRKRRLFLSFHYEDRAQVNHFRRLADLKNVEFDFYDGSLREPINSDNGSYIRSKIKPLIQKAAVLVCLIGNGTKWREWVDWEVSTAFELGKGVCGIRLKESYGHTPADLKARRAPMASWDMKEITAAIECAAARRS